MPWAIGSPTGPRWTSRFRRRRVDYLGRGGVLPRVADVTLRSKGVEPCIGHRARETHHSSGWSPPGSVCASRRCSGAIPCRPGSVTVPVRQRVRRHVYVVWRADADRRALDPGGGAGAADRGAGRVGGLSCAGRPRGPGRGDRSGPATRGRACGSPRRRSSAASADPRMRPSYGMSSMPKFLRANRVSGHRARHTAPRYADLAHELRDAGQLRAPELLVLLTGAITTAIAGSRRSSAQRCCAPRSTATARCVPGEPQGAHVRGAVGRHGRHPAGALAVRKSSSSPGVIMIFRPRR